MNTCPFYKRSMKPTRRRKEKNGAKDQKCIVRVKTFHERTSKIVYYPKNIVPVPSFSTDTVLDWISGHPLTTTTVSTNSLFWDNAIPLPPFRCSSAWAIPISLTIPHSHLEPGQKFVDYCFELDLGNAALGENLIKEPLLNHSVWGSTLIQDMCLSRAVQFGAAFQISVVFRTVFVDEMNTFWIWDVSKGKFCVYSPDHFPKVERLVTKLFWTTGIDPTSPLVPPALLHTLLNPLACNTNYDLVFSEKTGTFRPRPNYVAPLGERLLCCDAKALDVLMDKWLSFHFPRLKYLDFFAGSEVGFLYRFMDIHSRVVGFTVY